MPSLSLWLDYRHPVSEGYKTPVDPKGSSDFLWHEALNYTASIIYEGVPPAGPASFINDETNTTNASLSSFSGDMLDYYFPYIADMFHAIGLVESGVDTIAELLAAASSGGYAALALEIADVIAGVIHTTVTQASLSQLNIAFDAHVRAHPVYTVVLKETAAIPPSISGFKPLLCKYCVVVGYHRAPYRSTGRSSGRR